jgi:hypothetical protein
MYTLDILRYQINKGAAQPIYMTATCVLIADSFYNEIFYCWSSQWYVRGGIALSNARTLL